MNYYILENDKIILFDTDKERLEATIEFMPQYADLEIQETESEIISFNERFYFKDEIQEELAQAEAERIAKLYLTGADVERGIYQAKGMDFDDILAFVTANPPEGLDVKALKIELKANHFYRGNPYVDAIGGLLGFTKEQLDKFFETNDYTYLISGADVNNSEELTEENPVVEDITPDENVNNFSEDVNNTEVGETV